MIGDDLIQLGPIGVSTAQLGFHVLLADSLDDGPPANTPHIDVHEGDITSGTGSKGSIVTALFATLVGNDPGDFFTPGIKDAPYTLLDRGED